MIAAHIHSCRASFVRVALMLLALSPAPNLLAQTWVGTTGVRVAETYSDNIGRQSSGLARDDWSTEISPWLSYTGRGASTAGNLDARLQNWVHTDSRTSNRTGLQLNANGRAELLANHFFIDSTLNNDRQQLSQLSAADASYGGTSNSAEVTRFTVAPQLRWRLGDSTNASLRYQFEKIESEAAFASKQTNSAALNLSNGSAFGRLGWGFNAVHQNTDSQAAVATSSDSYTGSLTYAVTPELTSSLFGGQEFSDYTGGRRQHSWNWGGGLKWQPNERTTIGAQTSKRVFGRGFNYQISHRFQRSALEWSYGRDLNSISSNSTGAFLSADPRLEMYKALYRFLYPNATPETINQYAMAALAQQGISAFNLVKADIHSTQSIVDRNMRLAWVMRGVRNSVSLAAYASDRQTFTQTQIVQLGNDLSTHQRVKNRGWDANWTHDLTPDTGMGLRYGYSAISATTAVGALTSMHLNTVGLSLNTKFAPLTSGGLSYTHSRSTGSAEYRENAVTVHLNHTF